MFWKLIYVSYCCHNVVKKWVDRFFFFCIILLLLLLLLSKPCFWKTYELVDFLPRQKFTRPSNIVVTSAKNLVLLKCKPRCLALYKIIFFLADIAAKLRICWNNRLLYPLVVIIDSELRKRMKKFDDTMLIFKITKRKNACSVRSVKLLNSRLLLVL